MKDTVYKIVTVVLITLSIVLFGLSFIEYNKQQQRETDKKLRKQKETKIIPVSQNSLFKNLKAFPSKKYDHSLNNKWLKRKRYTALFILSSKVCIGCINEVQDFIETIASFDESLIQPVVIVAEVDPNKALEFLRKAKFKIPSFYGLNSDIKTVSNFLLIDQPVYQVVAFYDRDIESIKLRKLIISKITSQEYKFSILNRVANYKLN